MSQTRGNDIRWHKKSKHSRPAWLRGERVQNTVALFGDSFQRWRVSQTCNPFPIILPVLLRTSLSRVCGGEGCALLLSFHIVGKERGKGGVGREARCRVWQERHIPHNSACQRLTGCLGNQPLGAAQTVGWGWEDSETWVAAPKREFNLIKTLETWSAAAAAAAYCGVGLACH